MLRTSFRRHNKKRYYCPNCKTHLTTIYFDPHTERGQKESYYATCKKGHSFRIRIPHKITKNGREGVEFGVEEKAAQFTATTRIPESSKPILDTGLDYDNIKLEPIENFEIDQ